VICPSESCKWNLKPKAKIHETVGDAKEQARDGDHPERQVDEWLTAVVLLFAVHSVVVRIVRGNGWCLAIVLLYEMLAPSLRR
jgi:hypothetical protein